MDKGYGKNLQVLIISIVLVGLFLLSSVLANAEAAFGVSITITGKPIIDQNKELPIEEEIIDSKNNSNSRITKGFIGLFIGLFVLHIISNTMLRLNKNG